MKINARERAKRAKAAKMAARDRMRSEGLVHGETSPYALKIRRKLGRGAVDPRWQWWAERC